MFNQSPTKHFIDNYYLTEIDLQDNETFSLEKIKAISKYLGNNDAMTYKLYLKLNPPLAVKEIEYYNVYIRQLELTEEATINKMLSIFSNAPHLLGVSPSSKN